MDLLQSSLKMGERLKELRESKKLSFYSLSAAIKERYGVNISHDSLRLYEISEQYNSNAGKNNGMSLKNLKCLAAFYGVSADYLLGLSDIKTDNTELAGVCKYTGLDKETAEFLHLEAEIKMYGAHICRLIGDLCLSGTLQRDVWENILLSALAVRMAASSENIIAEKRKTEVVNILNSIDGDNRFMFPADVAADFYLQRAASLLTDHLTACLEDIRDEEAYNEEGNYAD